jgi:hypothetical protein
MDWDNKLCFQLIEEYRLNEVLWDPKNPSYYSKNLKHYAWCAISKNLNKDVEEVKKKNPQFTRIISPGKGQSKK